MTDTDTVTSEETKTYLKCPDCIGSAWNRDCRQCGGLGWVFKPRKTFKITTNPPPTETLTTPIYKVDPELRAFLTHLEEKIDRLLAALEDES